MKSIKSDAKKMYQDLFLKAQSSSPLIVIWQVQVNANERLITQLNLVTTDFDSNLLQFHLPQAIAFDPGLNIYAYSESGKFIFKGRVVQIDQNLLTISSPEEVLLLEEPDVDMIKARIGVDISTYWVTKRIPIEEVRQKNYMVVESIAKRTQRDQTYMASEFGGMSLDEEDKIFADQRQTPRGRPKLQKILKVQCQDNLDVHTLKLFDLSQGGISFLTQDLHLFGKGTKIKIVGFEDFILDDPLMAEVMSLRPVDELDLEHKVGCKFIDEEN
jgi:hypothetical protein